MPRDLRFTTHIALEDGNEGGRPVRADEDDASSEEGDGAGDPGGVSWGGTNSSQMTDVQTETKTDEGGGSPPRHEGEG